MRKCWLEVVDSEDYCAYLKKRGITIGENVRFRYPAHTWVDITRPSLVVFGSNIDVNDNFTLLTHDFSTYAIRGAYNDYINSSGAVTIGNNVVFGRNVTILKGVTIGDNTIVALGSVITKSTPPNSVIAGAPAKVVCSLEEFYQKRKTKSIDEALEYAASLMKEKRELKIEYFTEEWVHFLNKEDYNASATLRNHVNSRLNGYVKIEDYLKRKRTFSGFQEFINAAQAHTKKS